MFDNVPSMYERYFHEYLSSWTLVRDILNSFVYCRHSNSFDTDPQKLTNAGMQTQTGLTVAASTGEVVDGFEKPRHPAGGRK